MREADRTPHAPARTRSRVGELVVGTLNVCTLGFSEKNGMGRPQRGDPRGMPRAKMWRRRAPRG